MMKLLILLLLSISQVFGFHPLLLNRATRSTICDGAEFKFNCEEKGPTCKDDKTLVYCDSGEIRMSYTCVEKEKFCDPFNKKCVEINPCTSPASKPMDCIYGPEKFPSVIGCQEFYFCLKGGDKGVKYECPKGFNYDPIKIACIATGTQPCKSYGSEKGGACEGKPPFTVIPIPNYLNGYVLCGIDGNPSFISCPTPDHKFDMKTGGCTFVCPAEGFYPHIDKKKFNSCSREGTGLKPTERNCAKDTEWNPTIRFCAPVSK